MERGQQSIVFFLQGFLLELTKKKENLLKVFGISIKYFTFIKPTDETVATVNKNNILQLWDVSTGEFVNTITITFIVVIQYHLPFRLHVLQKSEVKLSGITTYMSSYPFDNYFAITFKNGKVELFKTLNNNELKHVAKMVLCDEEISSVHFLLGPKCIAASFLTGRFYYVNVSL